MSGVFLGIEAATSRTPTPYVSPVEPAGESGFGDLMKGLLKPEQPEPEIPAQPATPKADQEPAVQEKPARSPAKPAAEKKPAPPSAARKHAAPELEEPPAPSEGEEAAAEIGEGPVEEQPAIAENIPVMKSEAEVKVELVLSQMTEPSILPEEAIAPLTLSGDAWVQAPVIPADVIPAAVVPDAESSTAEFPDEGFPVEGDHPVVLDKESVPTPIVETRVAADAKPQVFPEAPAPAPFRVEDQPDPAAVSEEPAQMRAAPPAPTPEEAAASPAVQTPVAPAPEMVRERPVARAQVEAEVEEAVPAMTEDQAVEPVPVKAEASAAAAQPAAPAPQKTVSTPVQDTARPVPSPAPETPAQNLAAGATLLKAPVESFAVQEPAAKAEVAPAAGALKSSAEGKPVSAPAEDVTINVPLAAKGEASMEFSSDDPAGQQSPAFAEDPATVLQQAPRTAVSPLVNEAASFRAAHAAAIHTAAPSAPGAGVPGQDLVKIERLHELVERFDDHVMSLASGKDKTMSITLVPETLGKVVLNCREHGGQMSVEIVAESQVVRNLIQQQEPSVRHLLEQNGYKMDSFNVKTQDGQGERQPGQQAARDRESTPAAFRNASRTQGAGGGDATRPAAWKPAGHGGLWVVA